MPKKTRKAKIRASQRTINPGYVAPAPRTLEPDDQEFTTPAAAPAVTSTPARVSAPTVGRSTAPAAARGATPITLDYNYVFRDLRRIALLAVFFFAVMFALWFLIEVQHMSIIPGL